MANKNTKRNRVFHGYKSKTGVCIDSTAMRKKNGKKPYCAPTGGVR